MSKVQSLTPSQTRRSGRRARLQAESEATRAVARKKRGEKHPDQLRGVASLDAAREWLFSRGIEDIECVVPDQAGVGKMMPVEKFLAGPTMSLPTSILTQTITGDYPEDDESFQHDPADRDILFEPDFATLATVPWATDPTAQI